MTSTLITNIGTLVADRDQHLENNAAVLFDNQVIAWQGPASRAPAADTMVDAGGATAIPGFVDSHSHLVFAGDRSADFRSRMMGDTYSAGGIRSTVQATRAATDAELRAHVRALIDEMTRSGTKIGRAHV